MIINVTRDNVVIEKDSNKPHENEYNITQCHFTFDDFIDSFQVKRAIFTIESTGEMYETDIIDYECEIPSEVLKHEYETIKLGVYGFNTDNVGGEDVLLERFSPSYGIFVVPSGSYQEGATSPVPITPTQYDMYSSALQEGLSDVSDALDDIDAEMRSVIELGDITERQGNYAEQQGDRAKAMADTYATTVQAMQHDISSNTNNINTNTTNISNLTNRVGTNETDIASLSNSLQNYSLITETGSQLMLNIDPMNFKITALLKDKNGNTIYTSNAIDLPVESVVVDGRYDSETKEIILVLENGTEISFSVADLVSGLQTEITSENKLSSDLVDDTNSSNKFVTSTEKTTWNNKSDFSGNYSDLTNKPTIPTTLSDLTDDSTHRVVTDTEKATWNNKSDFSGSYNDLSDKPTIPTQVTESTVSGWGFTKNTGTYIKPSTGIPKTDLASGIQTSLGKADTALQSISSSDVTTALGYTPYNSTNPNGYTSNIGTITGVKMNGSTITSSGVADLGTVITEHQDISGKQDLLVSGTNIKTINNQSILGSGNITIEGGGTVDTAMSDSSTNAVQNKVIKSYVDDMVGDIGTILDNINGEVIGG